MKKYVVLFALFLTGIFFYPVLAQATVIDTVNIVQNSFKEYAGFLILGSGFLIAYNMARSLVPQKEIRKK